MAITIRNKETEAMIRTLARRHGEGPSAVIKRLASEELRRSGSASPAEYDRVMRAFDELARKYPPAEPRIPWSELEAEMDALFDYLEEDETPEQQKRSA